MKASHNEARRTALRHRPLRMARARAKGQLKSADLNSRHVAPGPKHDEKKGNQDVHLLKDSRLVERCLNVCSSADDFDRIDDVARQQSKRCDRSGPPAGLDWPRVRSGGGGCTAKRRGGCFQRTRRISARYLCAQSCFHKDWRRSTCCPTTKAVWLSPRTAKRCKPF